MIHCQEGMERSTGSTRIGQTSRQGREKRKTIKRRKAGRSTTPSSRMCGGHVILE
jgi:predicted protein tyrosine phosphatase